MELNSLKTKGHNLVNSVVDKFSKENIDKLNPFTASKIFDADPGLIPQIESAIVEDFKNDGFETQTSLVEGKIHEISLTKSNLFKTIVGLKSALKVRLSETDGKIEMKAGIGIFGQYALPTAAAFLIAWPVAIPAIIGMVKQSQLDDRAIRIAELIIKTSKNQ